MTIDNIYRPGGSLEYDMSKFSARDQHHIEFYHDPIVTKSFWRGIHIEKYPQDLMVYQEIIQECKPDLIIECGTRYSGSANFYGDMCEIYGNGHIVSIDINPTEQHPHPRVTYIVGDSGDPVLANTIMGDHSYRYDGNNQKVMVILDSDHGVDHVTRELAVWPQYVTQGQYLVVEDTNIHGHPILPNFGNGGPMEALDLWLPNHPEFQIDESREKYMITANPRGWLKRIS